MAGIIANGAITWAEPRRGLAEAAKTLRTAIATRRERRRAYGQLLRELQAYSRRDLLDMGIDPDGIHALARQGASDVGRRRGAK